MTAVFLEEFMRAARCRACRLAPKRRADGRSYSLCDEHLALVERRFRNWCRLRRQQRLCIHCRRRSVADELRCRVHKEVNRVRCLTWIHAHPERSAQQWTERKKMIADGRCPSCRPHRKLDGDHRRCRTCRKRHRETERAQRKKKGKK